MKSVFADTSFFVATIARRDSYHDRAVEFIHGYQGRIVTTDFVLIELANYLYRIQDRRLFEPVLRNIRENPQYMIVEATRDLLERGIELYVGRHDKEWSLTDCISFVVMKEHGITQALSSDGDFEQAGFRALLM